MSLAMMGAASARSFTLMTMGSFGAPPAFFPPSVSAWAVGSETICLLVGMLVQPFGRRPEFGVRATVFRGGNTRGF